MKKDLNMEMKKKKKFVVPGVLQVCEVMLEENLLGGSKEVQFLSSGVETTGQQVSTGGNTASDNSWSVTTGDYFD